MDINYFGANCLTISHKGIRLVIDDNLTSLGHKTITKADDIAIFTGSTNHLNARLIINGPGEYEVSDISIIGIAVRSHLDEINQKNATMYKFVSNDTSILVTGHIHPDINDKLLESIGLIDIMIVPVGGNGYTLDPLGALKIIKEIEPKLIIPTHYADKMFNFPVEQIELDQALKELSMEIKERTTKLRIKPGYITEVTQLVILDRLQ